MAPVGSFSGKNNFETAWSIVSKCWFPANRELVSKIQADAAKGIFDDNMELAVTEIKKDFALFTYCLKGLIELARLKNKRLPSPVHPVKLFHWAGIEPLRELLKHAHSALSVHSFDKMTDVQASRLEETITSVSTAELLSQSANLDSNLCYSTALLRQLGLTLIAWNYPHLYARAFEKLQENASLDQVLNRILGFSPTLLGVAMARQWNLNPEIRMSLGDKNVLASLEPDKAEELLQTSGSLEKLCQIGEALARANDPEHYPSAKSDWNTARVEIEKRLGVRGFKLIHEQISRSLEQYTNTPSDKFKQVVTKNLEKRFNDLKGTSLVDINRFIQQCPLPVQKQLRDYYLQISPDTISKDHIRTLTARIIPGLGFSRGCIYIFDPDSSSLIPRLAIGAAQLSEFKKLECSPLDSDNEPALAAYRSDRPIVTEQLWDHELILVLATVLGTIQRAGVLYLEASAELAKHDRAQTIVVFQALNHTLADCLKLR